MLLLLVGLQAIPSGGLRGRARSTAPAAGRPSGTSRCRCCGRHWRWPRSCASPGRCWRSTSSTSSPRAARTTARSRSSSSSTAGLPGPERPRHRRGPVVVLLARCWSSTSLVPRSATPGRQRPDATACNARHRLAAATPHTSLDRRARASIFLFPLVWATVSSFSPQAGTGQVPAGASATTAARSLPGRAASYFMNSVIICAVDRAHHVGVSTLGGYAFARFTSRARTSCSCSRWRS